MHDYAEMEASNASLKPLGAQAISQLEPEQARAYLREAYELLCYLNGGLRTLDGYGNKIVQQYLFSAVYFCIFNQ